jgi:hypothetical protein
MVLQSVALILHGYGRCGMQDERLFNLLAEATKNMRVFDLQVLPWACVGIEAGRGS